MLPYIVRIHDGKVHPFDMGEQKLEHWMPSVLNAIPDHQVKFLVCSCLHECPMTAFQVPGMLIFRPQSSACLCICVFTQANLWSSFPPSGLQSGGPTVQWSKGCCSLGASNC